MRGRTAINFLFIFFITVAFSFAGESVTFKGTGKAVERFVLKGILVKPPGKGQFPAVVMLPGGGAFNRAGYDRWVDRFVNWGYVVLKVKSLRSRGFSSIFEGDTGGASLAVSKREVAQDAHDGKAYLSGLAFVDKNRIVLSGWGFGGGAVLRAVDPSVTLKNRDIPFKAAVAFYPMCDQPLMGFDTPLLVLNGELDDWHPAIRCTVIKGGSKHEIFMKTYPGAYMFFDLEGTDDTVMGHRLLYNPVAATDASEQVRKFFSKNLK